MESEDCPLSPRQLEVLGLVGKNYSSKEIGRRLGISAWTVEHHVGEARKKLGGLSRGEAARWVREYDERRHDDMDAVDGRRPAEFEHPSKSGGDVPSDEGPRPMGIPGGSRRHPSSRDPRTGQPRPPEPLQRRPIFPPGGMFNVIIRYIVDAFCIALFFAVILVAAYIAQQLVHIAEELQLDGFIVLILKAVEVVLITIDGVGVVIASTFLTYRFLKALIQMRD